MSHVVVVGSYAEAFLTHLQAANYSYSVNETYQSNNVNEESPAAVAIYGPDTGLDPSDAFKLLKSNSILLLFTPSIEFLKAIKDVTKTSLDISRIKLTPFIPLIVYRIPAADRFHFVPGFSLKTSKDGKSQASDSELLEFSVKLIAECASHASEVASNDTNLTPEIDTRYFFSEGLTVRGQSSDWSANWRIDWYCYAANHIPDKDFNGKVYVVFIHSGQARTVYLRVNDVDESPLEGLGSGTEILRLTMHSGSSDLSASVQSPQNGQKSGDMYSFQANWKERLNLFKGPKSQPAPFDASYSSSYSIKDVDQVTALTSDLCQFVFHDPAHPHPVPSPLYSYNIPIYGISVLTTDRLFDNYLIDFEVDYPLEEGDKWIKIHSESHTFDLTFKNKM